MLEIGDRAPDFILPGIDKDGNEREFSLSDFKGKKVILYFYPKDNTRGCTTEACDFRDNMARVSKKGFIVLGVSPDSVASHRRFKDKYGLRYPLLSDIGRKIAELYGAFGEKKLYGKKIQGILRSTFLINGQGNIEKLWRNIKAAGHVDELLKEL